MKKLLFLILFVGFTVGLQAQSAAWFKATVQKHITALSTSSGLAGSISDETGSGALVFGTAPTITNLTTTGVTVAGIDSFWTTSVSDTITDSNIGIGDIFTFAEYTPNYSTAIDTVSFAYKCESGRVLVYRTTPAISGAVYKSGGLYSYIRINK